MAVAAAALVVGAIVWAGLHDRRILVASLGVAVITNASSVLEEDHGVPGFLPPLALLVVGVCLYGRLAHPSPQAVGDEAARSVLPLVGVGLVAAAFVAAGIGPFVADQPAASTPYVEILAKDLLIVAALGVAIVDRPSLRAGLAGLAIGGALVSGITVVQMLLGLQAETFGGFGRWTTQDVAGLGEAARAAGPFFDDPNSYAQHLAVAFGAAVGLATTAARRTPIRTTTWVCVGLMAVAMVGTSSRTGLLALAAVGGVVLWTRRPTTPQIIAAGALVAAVVAGPFGVGDRLATLGQVRSVSSTTADQSLTGRASEALSAVRMFADHPLTGVGYGAYPSEYLEVAREVGLERRFEPRSAHSLPLEIAAEQGLLGVAVWTALVMFAVVVASRLRRRGPDVGLPLMLTLVGFAATAIFLHDAHPRVMWVLVGLVVGGSRILARPASPAHAPVGDHRPVVAMVIQNYLPAIGGAERQLASLLPRLEAAGIRPVVITRRHEGLPRLDEIDGVPVVRLGGRGPKALRSLRFVVGARRELARIRPDVVHAFDTLTPSTIAIGHRRSHGAPVMTKLLRSGDQGDLAVLAGKRFGRSRIRALVGGVDLFVAISSDITDELRALDVPDHRIARIPNGVDVDRFRPPRGRRGRNYRVIATGRLAPEKRLASIARRWPRVRERCPAAQLVIVGDGPERPRLEAFDGVEVLGPRDDVAGMLRSAAVYVSASEAEGLSNSLLEAMASGLPCVVTDVGGVRDVVRDGNDGVVVPADDLDALVDAVARLLPDRSRRAALGRAARRRVRDGWSLDATASALAEQYHRLARVPLRRLDDVPAEVGGGSAPWRPTAPETADDAATESHDPDRHDPDRHDPDRHDTGDVSAERDAVGAS
jgi:glycosyltransferase involved in cell wall biosynthesis